MNVLFVTEHFYPHIGGAEKLLLDLALSLQSKGLNVKVITSNSGGITGNHKHKRLEIHSYKWRTLFGHPIPDYRDILCFSDWADIIQTAQYTAAPPSLKASKKINKPCVIMSYEYLGKKWKLIDNSLNAKLFQIFEWWVFHKSYDSYIAISKASKKDLIKTGIDPKKISVIYPVFNDFNFWKNTHQKSTTSSNTFLFYGRPGKTKGVFILLEAIKLLDKKISQDIHFNLILSHDPIVERKKVISFIHEFNLKNRISVLGPQTELNLRSQILDSYAVIVPSLTEGFGYSAYQACLLGKNVIVSNAGSLPEVISGNCLIFKNGSAVSLAEAIQKALKDRYNKYIDRVGGDNTNKIVELYSSLIR